MILEHIKAHIARLPETANWLGVYTFFDEKIKSPRVDWELPLYACEAVGSNPEFALPGSAALACLQISIILVDDILDNDPRGEYHRMGYGPTANLALALQAAAFRLIEQASFPAEQQIHLVACLAKLTLDTSAGQAWDAENLQGEENYWKVVRAKSVPFYASALQLGGIIGNAPAEMTQSLYELGALIGEMIQIKDDLTDAFETPANADWTEGRNNLLLLYAKTAVHPQQAQFIALLPQTDQPEALEQAQQILISCGAVSYCAYHLIERYQEAHNLLASLDLPRPARLHSIMRHYAESLTELLKLGGINVSVDWLQNPQ